LKTCAASAAAPAASAARTPAASPASAARCSAGSDASGAAVATGRLLPDGHIGRMAVLREARSRGAGSLVLRALMAAARERGHAEVVLSAQTHAIGFYERHGYLAEGEEYDDCGIPHVDMRCRF
jgi:predicted GNAT family N-acyltransferase